MQLDEWEKFHGRPTIRIADRYYVTMNSGGRILLNDKTFYDLRKPEAVFLFYNRARNQIALEPASPRMPNAFPVRKRAERGWIVFASPFCRHHNISFDGTYHFLEPNLRDGRLILKLDETVRVSRVRKRRKIA